MRYLTLACDYDGTLAGRGVVAEGTLAALERLRDTGRRVVLVTGRVLDDLLAILPRHDLFDRIVAENGAVLYRPTGREERLLAEALTASLADRLRERGVQPLSVGRVLVATTAANQHAVLDAIRASGLDLRIAFNKESLMVLPAEIGKGSGLRAALRELGMSPHEVVGIGDAENDQALLALCECSAAVAGAVPSLKERVDLVTHGDDGAGVVEVVQALIADDLRSVEPRLSRWHVLVGTTDDGRPLRIPPYGGNVLVVGPSGCGKTTLAMAVLEQLAEQSYQFVIIDPEGDYSIFADAIELGDIHRPPRVEEILHVLENPDTDVSVNLLGIPLGDRPAFLEQLLPRLQSMRARAGRPHWILIDEAHHLWPAAWGPVSLTLSAEVGELVLVTIHPDEISPAILSRIDIVISVGPIPEPALIAFSAAIGEPPPRMPAPQRPGGVLVWNRGAGAPPQRVTPARGRAEHLRHLRKYAEGNLRDKSFYFRGADGRLNLRARNLALFIEIAEGVDDATWLHHLAQGDYSRWFLEAIKDPALSARAAEVEASAGLSPRESRALIADAITARYTLPARP
ncbi:MAG: HAD-IIB family hydrolase [Polyangiaceae bacterium]|nr:HAD-IIB family hydrolase [Polyangiaceae bacterium]